ncbi:MAG TPA: transcriptional repressor [Gemmatimonadales bacterium]|jgi:Fur family ferric uptake transcriptional regulator|nr:transcriptional repressor [Gemmatimonadales bacterium]
MTRLSADARAELLERFHGWLGMHRLPVTRQRDAIADAVFSSDEHLSVEELRERLEAGGARFGTATIYRTLDLLERGGFVRRHQFGARSGRFEPEGPAGDHGHLICERCGKVVEFTHAHLDRLLPLVADEHGFRHVRHRVEIGGICRECLQQEVGGPAR